MLLEGKICLVTGAGKGIGRATMEAFIREGAIVYANDIVEGSIDDYAAKNSKVLPLYFDVSDSAAAKKAIIRINSEQHRIDVLVNNAEIMKDALIGTINRALIESYSPSMFMAQSSYYSWHPKS